MYTEYFNENLTVFFPDSSFCHLQLLFCSDYFTYLYRLLWFSLGLSKSLTTLLDNRDNLIKDFPML